MLFLAVTALSLTARGLRLYLWCKLQARAKTPETGGGAGGKRERREKTFLKLRKNCSALSMQAIRLNT
jgi:hypothetical protein